MILRKNSINFNYIFLKDIHGVPFDYLNISFDYLNIFFDYPYLSISFNYLNIFFA